ncbi:hypothetical protein SAMN05421747_10818 [Parapedobacter composti]|uniref:Xaa-Pro dipeptidyl-peptidase-like domain-containing protein n=1 Tax=Parapedobacter composti TaxID=623281 RepID=A0A1I1I9H9_9SPHI|nr:alpha/beta fold hydrolase [Parapedobacter composti]SFC30433.1 hypothetical protein SAMN05421747_10818 [Parapedobacter composti]
MRTLIFFFILLAARLQAQDIGGTWQGTLDISGVKLRLMLHIEQTEGGYTATMDSPDQGAKGIPVASVDFASPTLKLGVPIIGARYIGNLEHDTVIVGTFFQGGMELPLELVKRARAGNTSAERPQEPKPPFPYHIEEVNVANRDAGITLAGTLTRPMTGGPFPAMVLISGSGPQNRDEELFGHKPFWVIADYLTRHGYAVLRCDDRGVGASTGIFATATTADFASDASAAVDFLRSAPSIDPDGIGILGHSEGGMVAAMVASTRNDIAFLVLLASPGIPSDSLLMMQTRMIGAASGLSPAQLSANAQLNRQLYDLVIGEDNPDVLDSKLEAFLSSSLQTALSDSAVTGEAATAAIMRQKAQLNTPWMRYFLRFNPAKYLSRVKCPVLALNGDKDLQVAAKENLTGIAAALQAGGNEQITVKALSGLNHLFQESKTGLPAEYSTISQTISPMVLEEVRRWLDLHLQSDDALF